MNRKYIFFAGLLCISIPAFSQFNTVLQKDEKPKVEPVVSSTRNRILDEEEESPKIYDAVLPERRSYWSQRRYLSLPIDSMVITSKYGVRKDPFTGKPKVHKGIDLKGYRFATGEGLPVPEYGAFRKDLWEKLKAGDNLPADWDEIQIGATIGVHTGPYPVGAGFLRKWTPEELNQAQKGTVSAVRQPHLQKY